MKKSDAIYTIVREAQRTKVSPNAGVQRTVTALRVLGLDGAELIEALYHLEICDREGKPFSDKITRTW